MSIKRTALSILFLGMAFLLPTHNAIGNVSIGINGHASPLLQLSLNGSAYQNTVVDSIQIEPLENSFKRSTLSVRTNMMKWSLNAQAKFETMGYSLPTDMAHHVFVKAQSNQLQTLFVSEPVNLASISNEPKTLLTSGQPTENSGNQIDIEYRVVGAVTNTMPLSASVQYKLAAAP